MAETQEKLSRVLLIEDDTFLVGMYVAKLEMERFLTLVANEGEQGLAIAKREIPDLILLDIVLPKMDGFLVLEELKRDPTTRSIPVILLTNLGQKKDVERGMALGASDYLIKAHFMPSEVIEKIKHTIERTATLRSFS
ncbi:MAG: response regulator [bacterium]